MHRHRILMATVLLTALVLVGCATVAEPRASQNAGGFTEIGVDELAEMIDRGELTLINVHIPYAGEIPGTTLHIAFDEISTRTDLLPATDTPIVLYCRSGSMSQSAATELAALGYTHIIEAEGGMVAWEASGRELVFR